jgi:protein-L-isoaspartate(D-aspartate) O-methyltransferase
MPDPEQADTGGEDAPSAEVLRTRLVDQLCRWGVIADERVADALRAVPRHLFTPGVSLEAAYARDVVVTKRDEHGVALSSVSAPGMVAAMLEQLQVKPGHHVLEIGSGGYNAALLAELVSPDGSVTTIDIDPDIADRAQACLAAAGVQGVRVRCADGEFGAPEHAPFQRIIVTAAAWDLPAAWVDQLADGGRLVVPLRLRNLTRTIAFEPEDGHLAARDYRMCGFVPMQGAGAHPQQQVFLHGREVGLYVDDDADVDVDRLREALASPRVEEWSQVTVGGSEPFEDLDLWLSTVEPGFGFLTAQKPAVARGLVEPAYPWGAIAVHDRDSFAYLTKRPTTPAKEQLEFGVLAHGPNADKLAHLFVDHIQTWDRERRSGPRARIEAYPAAAPDEQLPTGLVLSRQHMKVTISWP